MAKRLFDIIVSFLIIIILFPLIIIIWFVCSIDSKSTGFFLQTRIGLNGKEFVIFKFRTFGINKIKPSSLGLFIRKYKLDEIPQLFNVVLGNMSMVGPRPDVKGYYDTLKGDERKILFLKPGITSLAAIKYRREDLLLENEDNPQSYNDNIIFPDKVKMNLEYYKNQSLLLDLKILFKTIIVILFKK